MREFDVLNAARKSLRRHLGERGGVTGVMAEADCLVVGLQTPELAGEVPDRWEGIPVRTRVMDFMEAQRA